MTLLRLSGPLADPRDAACPVCGDDRLGPSRSDRIFCSGACRQRAYRERKAAPAQRPVTARPRRRFHPINDLLGDFGDAPVEPWERTIGIVNLADRTNARGSAGRQQ